MSCISGYKLTNNLCISNFNYGFSITFNVASNLAFVNNYYNFLLQLANSINTTISNIAISNINYAVPKTSTLRRVLTFSKVQSVAATASGMISTPATSLSTQADTQYSALSTLMSSGTIGGMQVSVYSLSTNGGSVNDNKDNNSDGSGSSSSSSSSSVIIIATVIPICLVRTI
jgi:hypothetical protein